MTLAVDKGAIDELLEAKKAGAELERGPKIPSLSRFIETEIARLEQVTADRLNARPDVGDLNTLFRTTLEEVWRIEMRA